MAFSNILSVGSLSLNHVFYSILPSLSPLKPCHYLYFPLHITFVLLSPPKIFLPHPHQWTTPRLLDYTGNPNETHTQKDPTIKSTCNVCLSGSVLTRMLPPYWLVFTGLRDAMKTVRSQRVGISFPQLYTVKCYSDPHNKIHSFMVATVAQMYRG